MKNSIKQQMMTAFMGVIILLLAAVFLVNTSFLGHYYTSNKQKELKAMYQTITQAVEDGSLEDADVLETLEREGERSNVSVVIVGADGIVTYSSERQKQGTLYAQMFGYLLDQNKGEIVESTDEYQIAKMKDRMNQSDYLEMWGVFDDESLFLLRTPLESIRDTAALANQFLLYVGLIAVLIGSIFVWFFAGKIADPLLELVALSKRMAGLDFEARYTSGGENEIGVLGENFNIMSRRLEKTVSELKSANNQLQEDIEQKEKLENMRSEFLGNVSHELKTPIALIQGYAEGLKEGVNDDPESRDFYCDVIMDEANKMNQMVKNLLVLNQLEFGSEELEFARIDIVKLIKGVLASCEILLQQADAHVDFIADEAVYVWADEFKTEQVFRNYLTNAIHHVDNEKRIEIRVISQEKNVRVTVFNSGTPIPEEDIDKLWDKFYKVDKAHTREYGGNGIGLSIVKAIMESFHQKYGVANFDNGVQFWFELDNGMGEEESEETEE